jgi:phosphatidate phosphatase APP1
VSASPWQLYAPLSEFVTEHGFPSGTFHLKKFRPKDRSAANLFASPEETKRQAIVPLLQAFPQRRFILVGDSGEKDPEIYATLAREYPRQVFRILIRNTTAETPDSPRFQEAFRDLPEEMCQVFEDPREIG